MLKMARNIKGYNVILIVTLILISCSRISQLRKAKTDFKVEFQENFKDDKISFYIDDCLVFKNEVLNSQQGSALTDMFIEVKKLNRKTNILVMDKKTIECQIDLSKIKLLVVINNVKTSFNIDLSKGKYIGLSKIRNTNKSRIYQSHDPFFYD